MTLSRLRRIRALASGTRPKIDLGEDLYGPNRSGGVSSLVLKPPVLQPDAFAMLPDTNNCTASMTDPGAYTAQFSYVDRPAGIYW